jgi:glycosyltransferase involved in cell wall biosynthesis
MRILVISNLYPPNVIGGYERLCFEVTAGLAELGHDMTVLTSRFGGRIAEYPRQTIVRELDLLTGPDIYTPFPGSQDDRDRINRGNLLTLERMLNNIQPDVIFAWNLFFLDVSMLTALEESRFRTVVMLTDNWLLVMRNGSFVSDFFRDYVHGDQVFVPPPIEFKPVARQSLLQKLSQFIGWRGNGAPSEQLAAAKSLEAIFGAAFMRDLYTAGGSRFKRYRVIHNGVKQNTHATKVARDRSSLVAPPTLRLLFAGRLVDLKGAHTAIETMARLDPAALGFDRIELTILGDAQDAAYMQELNGAMSESPRSTDIILRPAVPEEALFELFDSHDIYLFPSLYEPFSLTLIHALACGIPTIASDTGGNPEIVRNGDSGLLFRKGDPADLARAVKLLAQDPSLRVRLSQNGQIAARAFTFERMVGEMIEFLRRPA